MNSSIISNGNTVFVINCAHSFAFMVSLRFVLVPSLSVILTITGKFPPNAKFPENLQSYSCYQTGKWCSG